MNATAGPWVYFFKAAKTVPGSRLRLEPGTESSRRWHYTVREIVPVSGESFLKAAKGTGLTRLETAQPLAPATAAKADFCGMVRHLNYTTQAQRSELQGISAKEVAASGETLAVLIPIRKSAAWWSLAQDERQAHFHRPAGRENHASIGHRYADKIFRKLYHARYFETLPGYDFLTYFEFQEELTETFRALLKELRHPELNPEWAYVDRECEIWMTKTGDGAQ